MHVWWHVFFDLNHTLLPVPPTCVRVHHQTAWTVSAVVVSRYNDRVASYALHVAGWVCVKRVILCVQSHIDVIENLIKRKQTSTENKYRTYRSISSHGTMWPIFCVAWKSDPSILSEWLLISNCIVYGNSFKIKHSWMWEKSNQTYLWHMSKCYANAAKFINIQLNIR